METNFVWVVYSSYEFGGDSPDAVFGTQEQAEQYIEDNDEDGWLEIAKFDIITGKEV